MSVLNQNAGYGQALLGRLSSVAASVCPTFGRIFVVLSPDDSADPNYQDLQDICLADPDGLVRFYTSLEAAYAAVTSNNDDVILLGGHTNHTIEAGIAWSKSRVHMVGMDGGHRLIQQGARINTTGNPSTAYLFKITGTRNSFQNIKFEQNSTNAAATSVVQMGGEGNLYKNCSFVFGTATNIDGSETDTYEVINGEDSGTFINCTFGQDTLLTTGGRAIMAIDTVTSGQRFKNNIFKDCIWKISTSDTDASFVRILSTADVVFGNEIINPIMTCAIVTSTGAVAMDDAVDSVANLVEGNILFVNPATNATDFNTDVTDQIQVVGPAPSTGAGPAVTSA